MNRLKDIANGLWGMIQCPWSNYACIIGPLNIWIRSCRKIRSEAIESAAAYSQV